MCIEVYMSFENPFIPHGVPVVMKAGLGRALRRAFRQEDLLSRVVPRPPGAETFLMHRGRMAIFSRLTFRPCSHGRALARFSGLSAPTTAWHCRKLASAGLLASSRAGNRLTYSPLDLARPSDVAALSLLSEDAPRAAVRFVARSPLNQRALAKRLGTYQQEASFLVARLLSSRILEVSREGREAMYAPSGAFEEMVLHYASRAPGFRENLLNALEWDGLAPKLLARRGPRLSVEVDRGTERVAVELCVDPLAELLRAGKGFSPGRALPPP
jgi:hypothetical protein